MDKKHCRGCRDDHYNHGNNSPTGECWSLKYAKLETRILVPVDLRPPYTHLPREKKLTCFSPKGYVNIKPDALDSQGYWKR